MTRTLLIGRDHRAQSLRLRTSWLNLQGGIEEMVGQQSPKVGIPEDKVVDVEALQRLMELE